MNKIAYINLRKHINIIIDILNDIKEDEDSCNEGSLTDDKYYSILYHLYFILEENK